MTEPTPRWSAVVLGGGDPGDPFAAAHGVDVKPLIPLVGQPMALYVLRALRDSGRVSRVAYVGPTVPELDPLIDERVTDRGTLLGNLEAGVDALAGEPAGARAGGQARVLVVTADIPMLTAEDVRAVLDSAPLDAGLVYPVVRRGDCEAAYPGVKRTYAALKDGTFTGGNLFLLDPSLIREFLPKLREILAARKAPLRLAGIIGVGTLARLLTRQLTIRALEERVSGILGVPARALVTPRASIGTDVDKDGDLELARRTLGGAANGAGGGGAGGGPPG